MVSWTTFEEAIVNGTEKHTNQKILYDALSILPIDTTPEEVEGVARASMNEVYETLKLDAEALLKLQAKPTVLPTLANPEDPELYYVFERDITTLPGLNPLEKLQRILQVANISIDVFSSEVLVPIFQETSLEHICPRIYVCSIDVAQNVFSIYFSHTYRSTVEELKRIIEATGNTYEYQASILERIFPGMDIRYIVQSKLALTGLDYNDGMLPKLKYYFFTARLTQEEIRRLEEVSGINIEECALQFDVKPNTISLISMDFIGDQISKVKHYFRVA